MRILPAAAAALMLACGACTQNASLKALSDKPAPEGSPREVGSRSPERLAETPTYVLAWTYGYQRRYNCLSPNLRPELERRNAFTAEQWERIEQEQVQLGDPEELVVMAWGPADDHSTLTKASGTSAVLMYGSRVERRVYLKNGSVIALGR